MPQIWQKSKVYRNKEVFMVHLEASHQTKFSKEKDNIVHTSVYVMTLNIHNEA